MCVLGGVGVQTSVLSLSAAIPPNHKHGHVQICPCLVRLPAEMLPDHGFFNIRTRGNTLARLSETNVSQGHTNIDSGGTNKQVVQKRETEQTASQASMSSLCLGLNDTVHPCDFKLPF